MPKRPQTPGAAGRTTPGSAGRSPLATLARAIDAGGADAWAQRFTPALSGSALQLAVLLATAYPALGAALEAAPDDARTLAREGHRATRDRATLLARLRRRLAEAGSSEDVVRRELRRFARLERARIALRELLPASAGGADIDVTGAELAALAEATIEVALEEAVVAVSARFGTPRTAEGAPGRFVVLGMGKLGGAELNAGSDVDLVYFYDTDEGEAVAPDGTTTSLHELWTRVGRRLTATLEDVADDGFVWRVDLRLRPEGQAGPLVNSLAAAERYYESFGRLWERAALLRARPVAGDAALGDELMAMVAPFVWRRGVDPTIAVEMTHLAQRARAELSVDALRDLKLGPGGIREAEFFVQTLQLVWGGREPRLRVPGTLSALRRLRAAGLVTDREGREIFDGYLALRRAEHAVQAGTGVQTHLVPAPGPDLARLARALGFADAQAFVADLERRTARIAARFASLLPKGTEAAAAPSRWSDAVAALERSDREAFADALARGAGTAELGDVPRELFELSRRPDAPLGARSREASPELAEAVLDAVLDAADPEQAARFLRILFGRLPQVGVYAKLLGDEPRAMRRLCEALGASAFIAEAVVGNPELCDLVLFSRGAPTAESAVAELHKEIAHARGVDDDDEEGFVGALRRARSHVVLEVGLGDLSGELDTRQATRVLSALADATLEAAVRRALGAGEGEPTRGLSVVAMGKLGGREIGYGSDLDVIFLYDPTAAPGGAEPGAFFARAARRVIRLIATSHSAGPGYELDTRLRPSGSQGLLVTSLDAFARYHGREDSEGAPRLRAATWERLALLRARPVAGDAELGRAAMIVAHAAAYEVSDDPRAIAGEIHRLRLRMQAELSSERAGRYDLKLGRGGLCDIEFTVQLLQMLHGDRIEVRTTETGEAVEALAAVGALSAEHADTLREGYAFLRKLEQRIRIVHADASHLLEESAPGLGPLARRMGSRARRGEEAAAELLAWYRDVTERIRGVYDAIVVARST